MARKADNAKRALLAEKALEVFGDRGFRGTTIKRIAEQAGLAPGSVYTYFKDKRALFHSTVGEGWDAFLASLDALAGSRAPFARTLGQLLDTGFAELATRLPLVRGIIFEPGRGEFMRGKIDELCRRHRTHLRCRPPAGSAAGRRQPGGMACHAAHHGERDPVLGGCCAARAHRGGAARHESGRSADDRGARRRRSPAMRHRPQVGVQPEGARRGAESSPSPCCSSWPRSSGGPLRTGSGGGTPPSARWPCR